MRADGQTPGASVMRPSERLALWCLRLSLGVLFVVIIEPAPSDVMFALAMLFLSAGGRFKVAVIVQPFFLMLLVFFAANLVSALAWKSASFGGQYLAITSYMLLIPLVMAHFAARGGAVVTEQLYRAFFVAATVSAVIGAMALLHVAPGPITLYFRSDDGLRLSPLFKDPNVFGPFMGAAGVLLIGHSMRPSTPHKALRLSLATFLLAMMFLTFSRGAWLGTGVAAVSYFILMLIFTRNRRSFNAFILFSSLGSVITVLLGAVMLSRLGLTSFLAHRFALQSYDTNRFANWAHALEVVRNQPFGIGPGHYVGRTHFPASDFGLATHNVYLKVAVENGWLGFLAFFGAVALLCAQLLRQATRSDDRQPLRIAIVGAILGQLANSIVVDSLHWRHLFVVLGFACCELILGSRQRAIAPVQGGTCPPRTSALQPRTGGRRSA